MSLGDLTLKQHSKNLKEVLLFHYSENRAFYIGLLLVFIAIFYLVVYYFLIV